MCAACKDVNGKVIGVVRAIGKQNNHRSKSEALSSPGRGSDRIWKGHRGTKTASPSSEGGSAHDDQAFTQVDQDMLDRFTDLISASFERCLAEMVHASRENKAKEGVKALGPLADQLPSVVRRV